MSPRKSAQKKDIQTSASHKTRISNLLAAMKTAKIDGLLVTHLPDVRYLIGFTGSAGVLAVGAGKAEFFTDGRYTQQAKEQIHGASVRIVKDAALLAATEWLSGRARAIGFDQERMPVQQFEVVRERLQKQARSKAQLVSASFLLSGLKERKDSLELEQLQRAVNLGSSLFPGLVKTLRPGVPESEVAAKLAYAARMAGAEGMAFDVIIASGERSALPHGRASRHPIPSKGFVVLDFGVILAGYCSDMTRTVHMGKPGAKMRAMYDAVLEAQLAGIAAVKAGVTAGDVDHATRRVLERAGFGRYFSHSTGHGVGLEIHEGPRIGRGIAQQLQAGMVITIEPGIYIPGVGGVRIEDMVAVTETGCTVLTPTSKELIVI